MDDSSQVPRADTETQPVPVGNSRLDVESQGLKRSQIIYDEDSNAKRPKYQWSLPATPSSSPFQTLRVTKSRNISSRNSLSKIEEVTPGDHDVLKDEIAGSQRPLGRTPTGQLTPHPTGRGQKYEDEPNHSPVVESANGLYEISSSFFADDINSVPVTYPDTPVTIDSRNKSHANLAATTVAELPTNSKYLTVSNNGKLCQNASDADELAKEPVKSINLSSSVNINLEDEYPLDDDLMEEDIACLLDTAMNNVRETHIPPSSVTLAWDHDSRSAAEYDPTLQYSSPLSSLGRPGVSQSVAVPEKLNDSQDDLLDEEVDWNAVYAMVSIAPKNPSSTGHQGMVRPSLGDGIAYIENPITHNPSIRDDTTPLKPFVRPPFPAKVRDRSIIPGVSSDTMLRTCFRIGEMINQAAHCLNHRQEVVFELFARVTYSSRESLQRRQHFQFIDLFKDQRPYPAGILSDWRVGSQLDRQSSTFLGTSSEPRMCRCVCRPMRDPKITIGFNLMVLAIRGIDWMQIRWTKKIVCGGSDDAA